MYFSAISTQELPVKHTVESFIQRKVWKEHDILTDPDFPAVREFALRAVTVEQFSDWVEAAQKRFTAEYTHYQQFGSFPLEL